MVNKQGYRKVIAYNRDTDWYLGQCMNAVGTSVFDRVSTDSIHLLCCQPCRRRQRVLLPCARAPFLSKQKRWLAEGVEPRSRTVISVNGGPLSKWNSGYVTHNEDRRGLRLPHVLFCLNGMHAVRWDGRRDSCGLHRDRNTGPPLLHTRSAFHFRKFSIIVSLFCFLKVQIFLLFAF